MMRVYEFTSYEWDGDGSKKVFLYNEKKTYSDIEYKELCAELYIDMCHRYVKKFPKMYLTVNMVQADDVYGAVLKLLYKKGFKQIKSDCCFGLFDTESVLTFLDEDSNGELESEKDILKYQYLKYQRKQKLNNIINQL